MSYRTRYAAMKRQQASDRAESAAAIAWRKADQEAAKLLEPILEETIAKITAQRGTPILDALDAYNKRRAALAAAIMRNEASGIATQ